MVPFLVRCVRKCLRRHCTQIAAQKLSARDPTSTFAMPAHHRLAVRVHGIAYLVGTSMGSHAGCVGSGRADMRRDTTCVAGLAMHSVSARSVPFPQAKRVLLCAAIAPNDQQFGALVATRRRRWGKACAALASRATAMFHVRCVSRFHHRHRTGPGAHTRSAQPPTSMSVMHARPLQAVRAQCSAHLAGTSAASRAGCVGNRQARMIKENTCVAGSAIRGVSVINVHIHWCETIQISVADARSGRLSGARAATPLRISQGVCASSASPQQPASACIAMGHCQTVCHAGPLAQRAHVFVKS